MFGYRVEWKVKDLSLAAVSKNIDNIMQSCKWFWN